MDIQKILKKRNIWMALAMIWIVYYHADFHLTSPVLKVPKVFGYGGVDIFLFASGIGCWYSLKKDSHPTAFLARRALRILPTYEIFMIFWVAARFLLFEPLPLPDIIGNLFCVQDFTGRGNSFNWYVSAMWLLYLLAPFFYAYLERHSGIKPMLLLLAGLTLFSVSFWFSDSLIISIARIPIFFLGMAFARLTFGRTLDRKAITLSLSAMAVGGAMLLLFFLRLNRYLRSCGLWWYPFILITPGLCILISLLCLYLERFRAWRTIEKGLEALGKRTFAVYLGHVIVFEDLRQLIAKGLLPDSDGIWLAAITLSLPISWGLHAAGEALAKRLKS